MLRRRILQPVLIKGPALLILTGLLFSTFGCERVDRDVRVVRLDPAQAAERAQEIRQEVSPQLAEGLELTLWASDTLVQDPVALDVDDQGRVYITRTNRQKHSEFDIRSHRDWMIESITLETVEDRRDFVHRELAPDSSEANSWHTDLNGDSLADWRDLTVEMEQIWRIEDESGDGVADVSQLFLEDFHTEVTDVAGAVMAYDGDVFVGVAPDLWRVPIDPDDGTAGAKESISHGYGVHIGFGGHGMSGLIVGPDGKIYWGIGDIGFNGTGPDGREWAYPNQGVIVRANPDGSDFEVFAAGLRNTHEFEFDEYGNIISVDNDGDHAGESERLVYIVEGSDTGWRTNWQFGKYVDPKNNEYKVWMDEEMYKPRFEGQAAYITPPIVNYHSGPAGMAYNPGTALSEEWRDFFFVSEFVGTPARSRIHAFRLEESGAGFELAEDKVAVDGILATGLDFGPDGALYYADWIEGWNTKNRGRVWRLDTPAAAAAPVRAETQTLLAEDLSDRSEQDLLQLLQHADMRVRLKAQFALADQDAAETLLAAVRQTGHQLARVHGIWGIGQLAREDLDAAEPLTAFLTDSDPEIRAQAAKIIGDVRYAAAGDELMPLLQDTSARARFFAAEALGRIQHAAAVQPLIGMLEANDGEDVYLRHAGSLALARIGQADPILALADHPSRAVRIAAVVALRRMQHPGVAHLLQDTDEFVVTEAARAINDDASIEAALPDLARVLEQNRFSSEALLRRSINANLRVGGADEARRVAAFATRPGATEELRVEALAVLGVWPRPSILDRVDGAYRGEVQRDTTVAREAIAQIIDPMLASGSEAIRMEAAEAVGRLRYEPAAPALMALLRGGASAEVRIAALDALRDMRYGQMEEAVRTALADRDPTVRMTALSLIPGLNLPEESTVEMLTSVVGSRTVEEQQAAVTALGELHNQGARDALAGYLGQLQAGELAPEIQLDVMEAVEASDAQPLQARLEQYRASRPTGNPVAAYSETLRGGNADRGQQIVFQNPAGQCIRCHAVQGRGADVGPDLATVSPTLTREQLLEALVDPNARIAPGYGTVVLTLQNGETVSGILREDADAHVVIQTGFEEPRQIAKAEITGRRDGVSGMPPVGQVLNRRELRDVVEFLATLQ